MKILHLAAISVSMMVLVFLQASADEWGPLPSSYPENKTMMLSFSYLPKGQSTNGTEGSLHIKLFDAKTGLPVKDASFLMNVKQGNSQVMNSRFYTYSGSLVLNLQHGSDYQWVVSPDHDPIFVGGFESKTDTINVDVQPLAKNLTYYFEIELLTFDEPRMALFKPSGIKFGTAINPTIAYDQTISSSTFDLAPLKQFQSGTAAKDVKCGQEFSLVIKAEDKTPACVNPDTAQKLIERGWTKMVIALPSEQNTPILSSSLPVINTNFTINYNMTGGQISKAILYNHTRSLGILLQASGNGTITIDLPRTLIDAKTYGNTDDNFIVLGDGQQVWYEEIHKTMLDRVLSIPFQHGIKKIEIIGVMPI